MNRAQKRRKNRAENRAQKQLERGAVLQLHPDAGGPWAGAFVVVLRRCPASEQNAVCAAHRPVETDEAQNPWGALSGVQPVLVARSAASYVGQAALTPHIANLDVSLTTGQVPLLATGGMFKLSPANEEQSEDNSERPQTANKD